MLHKKYLFLTVILMGTAFTSEAKKESRKVEIVQKEPEQSVIAKDFWTLESNLKLSEEKKKYSRIVYANYYMSEGLINEQATDSLISGKLLYRKDKQVVEITKFDKTITNNEILKLLNKAIEIRLTTDIITEYTMAGPNLLTNDKRILEADHESLLKEPWIKDIFILDADGETLKVQEEYVKKVPAKLLNAKIDNPLGIDRTLQNLKDCNIKDHKILEYFNKFNSTEIQSFTQKELNIDFASLVSKNPEENKKNLEEAKQTFKEISTKITKYCEEQSLEKEKKEQLKSSEKPQVSSLVEPNLESQNKSSEDDKKFTIEQVVFISGSNVIFWGGLSFYGGKKWGKSEAEKNNVTKAS